MSSVQDTSMHQAPDWNCWYEYQELRLWRAVLLTMDVSPTKEARTLLLQDADEAKEYRRRKSVIRNSLSEQQDSPRKVHWLKDHVNNDNLIGEKMVTLCSVVAFAESKRWPIPDEMRQYWGAPKENTPNRVAAEENKNKTLGKIIAAFVYSLATELPTLDFQGLVTKIEARITKARLSVSRETLNDHIETAINDNLLDHIDLQKRLARPRNEKRS